MSAPEPASPAAPVAEAAPEFQSEQNFDQTIDDTAKALFDKHNGPTTTADAPAHPPEVAPEEDGVPQQAVAEDGSNADPNAEPEELEAEQEIEAEADVEQEIEETDGEEFVEVEGPEGETTQVSLRELVDSYERRGDYTKKTQGLAEERREMAHQASAMQMEHQQNVQRLTEVANALQAEVQRHAPDPREMENLRVQNPGEYAAQMQDQLRQKQLLDYAYQENAAIQERQRQEQIPLAIQALKNAEPAFQEDFATVYDQTGQWAISPTGGALTAEEWQNVIDPRQVLICYRAMVNDKQHQTIRAAAPRITKKVKRLPRVRAGAPVESGSRETTAYQSSLEAMKTDTSIDAIADAMRKREDMRNTRN